MTPEKLETGYISINFDSIDDAIEEAFDALDAYDERYDYFNDILETMREIDTSTLGVGVYDIQETCIAIEDKMNAIMRQKNGVAGKKDIVVAYKENAMNIENAVANHINTTLQDFCDANGIEYEDDSNPVWEFLCDIGDAICDFYEEFKYIIDVIVDVVACIVAVAAVVVAAAALAAASGFIAVAAAVAGVITAVFSVYESACSLFYSSAALHQDLLGNEEEAQRYSNIRDSGAGEYVFVQRLAACGIDSETASAIYGGIEVTMVVLDIFSCSVNVGSGIKKAVTNLSADASKYQKVTTVMKSILVKTSDDVGNDFVKLCDKIKSGSEMTNSVANLSVAFVEGDDVFSNLVSVVGNGLGYTKIGKSELFGFFDNTTKLIDMAVSE